MGGSGVERAVVIAGAGPTGMVLAAELALAGVEVEVVEPHAVELESSRAGGLHARTLEVLDQRGVVDRFLEAGQAAQVQGFAGIRLDISDVPSRFNHGLALWQREIERLLAGWVFGELSVPIRRGSAVAGFVQDDDGVDVALDGGSSIRAGFLVGCDGGRSVVRAAAGIEFAGWDASESFLIAEAAMRDEPPSGMRPEGGGIGPIDPQHPGGPYRMALKEAEAEHDDQPTIDDLRARLVDLYGTDFGVHDATWTSRFGDASRQAVSYRDGRVLLAGDAAHIHSPHGGQGLNTGVQDAVNLGWKLAQVVDGTSSLSLLDTYHAERHPVGARVLQNTMAQVALSIADPRHRALHDLVAALLTTDDGRLHVATMLAGLDIRYDLGDGHPLVGRRMPDLDVRTANGATRVYALLHDARPVLLNLGEAGSLDAVPRSGRVRLVDATVDGAWELPVIGAVDAPDAVLVRPDGHVAWVGEPTDPALPHALERWFGAPVPV